MLRKAFVSITLCAVLLMSPFVGLKVNALSADSISAPSAVLMESSTGKVLFEKNPHEQRPCASVTKVMTLLLVFEAVDSGKLSLDDEITASEHAAGMGGSDIWLEKGETMSADDMIKATVVVSANDAAVALAEHISGSEDAFVEKMNSRAKELGMNDTVFKNCNGLDEEGHITSAYDVALMSRELTKHEKIFDYTSIWLDNLRGGKTQIVNTNKLLKTYNGITGLKQAQPRCGLLYVCNRNKGRCFADKCCLGCKTGKERFADAAALLDYGFANVSVKELTLPEDMPKSIEVNGGMADSVKLECKVSSKIVVDKGNGAKITTEIDLPDKIDAPVEKNRKIGTLTYLVNSKKVQSFDICAGDSVQKTSFGALLEYVFASLISL